MQLSSKIRYSIMAMADLAFLEKTSDETKPVSLAEIAERQKISFSYLESLFADLKKANLVQSTKGPGGGYKLALDSKNIKLSDIADATADNSIIRKCRKKCKHDSKVNCNSHLLWLKLDMVVNDFLESITLDDLLNRNFIEERIL